MLRQLAAIFLLIAFTGQTFDRSLITLDYYINNSAFTKNCENRARPKLHCNGKCQLMKKLQEQEKKDQQSPERKTDNKNEDISSKSFFTTLSFQKVDIRRNFFSYYNTSIPTGTFSDIFHPPGLM